MGPTLLLLFGLVLIGAAVLGLVYVLVTESAGPRGVTKSLSLIEQTVNRREAARADLPFIERLLDPLIDHAKALGYRLSPGGATARLARMLDVAGNPRPWNVERIMGVKALAMLLGVILGFLYGGFGFTGLLYAVIGGAALFFLPDLLVYNAGMRRQEELRRGLADSLDMLTVCVEAGQGFDAALLQVARAIKGPIAGEFARVLSEVQMGRSRAEAFQLMAERSPVPEVKNFVSALVQADKLGIPIGQVLREQTKQMRVVRRLRAEEKAQKVPVKILFPLLVCIFPVLFVVIIGPGAIKMVEAFSNL